MSGEKGGADAADEAEGDKGAAAPDEDEDAEPEEELAAAAKEQEAPKDDLPAEIIMDRPADAGSVTVPTDALGACMCSACPSK